MSQDIAVVPKEDIIVRFITRVRIQSISVDLFNSATIFVILYDADNNVINTSTIILTGEEYTNWGNSDTYIQNIVLQKLGLQKLDPTPPESQSNTV